MGIPKVVVRSAYGYDVDEASAASAHVPEGKSLTVQSSKDEADINVIVRQFGVTGKIPANIRVPLEEDFIDIIDYKGAQNAIRAANESFMALSADVRSRFSNDPAEFVSFCLDERNIEEMRRLGLAVPAAEPVAPAPSSPAPSA